MDRGADRAETAAEEVGDVGVGQVEVEASDDRRPLPVGEGGERVPELVGTEAGVRCRRGRRSRSSVWRRPQLWQRFTTARRR